MAYINGSITDANPGPALWAALDAAIVAAGFTIVDTVTISARTHKVYKSPAAGNTQGKDWYLDIGYTTAGAGTITLQPFEFYDPATDLGYRGLYSGAANTTIDATTSSRFGATGSALETNWIGGTVFTGYPLSIIATSFGYWFSATTDRVIMLLTTVDTVIAYVGFYQPDSLYSAKAGAALYPLVGAKISPSGGASGTTSASVAAALTRVPPATTLIGSGWGAHLYIPGQATHEAYSTPAIPSGSTTVYPFVARPLDMFAFNSGSAGLATHYGTLRDTAIATTTSAVLRGDTVTIAGAQWVLATQTNGGSVLFKAA